MSQINIESLDEGDELGLAEIPECCDALMDRYPTGFQCGNCDSSITHDSSLTITHVQIT
ncbi:hypothetical protein ACH4GK_31855 [Streptomyces rimosus]|uniref:hypothetical protein n=1 Tax=Streptomyces rimosus TaxID=1927 RepID=UPI000A5CD265|nr:hypothetical protein [Streptomyces rimosus]